MNTLNSLKCAAVLLPALAIGMPIANASDEKRDDPQDAAKTTSEFSSNRQDDRKNTTLPERARATAKNEFFENMPARGFHSDSLIGAEVKSRSSNESIGEISNLLLDEKGHVVAVILSVGGTLGMGERDVAIAWDQIERRTDGDETTLLVNQSEQSLKSAPKYSSEAKNAKETSYSRMEQTRADKRQDSSRREQPATASAKSDATKSDAIKAKANKSNANKSNANEVAHSQFLATMPNSGYHSDSLVGREVMNRRNDESIGEVSDLVLDQNGQVVAVIVSVGGVLGLGEHDVAIAWDRIERSVNGDEVTLSVDLTEESLEDAPKYTNTGSQKKSLQ